jgi:hypothetical protein
MEVTRSAHYVKLLSGGRVVFRNLLGRKENAKNNQTCSWVGISLVVYTLSAILMNTNGLLGPGHTISVAYAQQEQPPSPEASTPFLQWYETQKDNLSSNQTANPIAVKILSPSKDERVPAGQDLIVSGTSTDNATSDCKVSVIVNSVRPYQQTVANGTGGAQDYSTWNFVVTQTYTTIKEGPDNKITSKLECTPDLTKWNSVNVTGIGSTTAIPNRSGAATLGEQGSISSLSISVNVPSDSLTSGDDQTIEARVLDAVSHLQVSNAVIELLITDPLGNTAVISDEDGDILYTLGEEVSEEGEENTLTVTPGTYTAQLRASAAGYDPESRTTTFNLIEQDDEDEDIEDNEIMEEEDSESLGELFE